MQVKQENSLQKPPHRFWWKERDVQNQDDFCTNKICTIHKKPKITCKKRFWEDYLENEEHKDTGCISFQKNRDLPWDCIAMEVWILWMLSESEKALGTRATLCILWSVLITWHNTQILVGPFQFLEFKPAFNASTMHRERERVLELLLAAVETQSWRTYPAGWPQLAKGTFQTLWHRAQLINLGGEEGSGESSKRWHFFPRCVWWSTVLLGMAEPLAAYSKG